jgi:hypothetical protein
MLAQRGGSTIVLRSPLLGSKRPVLPLLPSRHASWMLAVLALAVQCRTIALARIAAPIQSVLWALLWTSTCRATRGLDLGLRVIPLMQAVVAAAVVVVVVVVVAAVESHEPTLHSPSALHLVLPVMRH